MQYLNEDLEPNYREKNITKAKDHLIRGSLDCYKLLWARIKRDLDMITIDRYKRMFAVNMPDDQFLSKYSEFISKAQEARRTKQQNVGIEPERSLPIYKEAIELGKYLMNNVDETKLDECNSFMRRVSIFLGAREFLSGIIIGLIVEFLVLWITGIVV